MNGTILITGATGFLGSHVLGMLIHLDCKLIILSRDHSDKQRINRFLTNENIFLHSVEEKANVFKKYKIDTVWHLATCYGRNGESEQSIFEANVEFPKSLVIRCMENGVPYFINTHTVLKKNTNHYADSKCEFRDYLNDHQQYFDRIIHIIPEYFFGRGDAPWKLITMLLTKLKHNQPKIPLTSGLQKRNFVYIDDMIEALKIIYLKKDQFNDKISDIYVGTDEMISIRELALFCKNQFPESSTNLEFGAIEDRKNEVEKFDNGLIKSLGWKPKYSIFDGIELILGDMRS